MILVVVFCCVSCAKSFEVTDEMETFRTRIMSFENVIDVKYLFGGHPHASYGYINLVITVNREVDSIDDPLVLQVFNMLFESADLKKDIYAEGPVECYISFLCEEETQNGMGFVTVQPGGTDLDNWYDSNSNLVTLTTEGITVTNTEDEVEFYPFEE